MAPAQLYDFQPSFAAYPDSAAFGQGQHRGVGHPAVPAGKVGDVVQVVAVQVRLVRGTQARAESVHGCRSLFRRNRKGTAAAAPSSSHSARTGERSFAIFHASSSLPAWPTTPPPPGSGGSPPSAGRLPA